MKTHRLVFALALFFAATGVLADCAADIRVRASTKITVSYATCADVTSLPAAGEPVTIDAGGQKIATMVVKAVTEDVLGLGTVIQLASTDAAVESVIAINNEQTVGVTIGTATIIATVLSPTPNYFKYNWAIGPASTGAEDGDSEESTTATANAIRLQYSADYARTGLLGDAKTFLGGAQLLATVSVDTTDQNDPSLIDNNRATLGFGWDVPPAGNLLKQGKLGFEGRASKAFHSDIRDIDATVTFTGWVPVLKTLNLFNDEGDFISTPLSFELSYGYRNRDQAGDSFDGKVFEASALYHIFAANRYKLDLQGTWTVNDLSNRPATTPRTQRMYKATVSYLADPAKGFSVMTTIEDGSAGVMLTKVREYFVGLAISKLDFSGGK